MLVVKLEVWPGGNESRAEEIGRAKLTNITGPCAFADYRVEVTGPGNYRAEGEAVCHVRRRGPWRLLQLALEAVGGRP